MNAAPKKNVGASVRARLQRIANESGENFDLVLKRYANERLLYRLAQSAHGKRFVLKGAGLFILWSGRPHRATRDIDLLGFGDQSVQSVRATFVDVLSLDVGDDGVCFDATSLSVKPIRADQEYGGVRVLTGVRIASAKLQLQIDVGTGDAITPDAKLVDFPTLLDFPSPKLLAYPRETVVAEKFHAMVELGIENTRMKDFYDLMLIANMFDFDTELLARAIGATFDRRGTVMPKSLPVALTSEFACDASKQLQWAAFVRKSGAKDAGSLDEAIETIVRFIEAPLAAARTASSSRAADSQEQIDAAWKDEIARRALSIKDGSAVLVDADDVERELAKALDEK